MKLSLRDLIGQAIFQVPLIMLIGWMFFKVLHSTFKKIPRWVLVIIGCTLGTGLLMYLEMSGRNEGLVLNDFSYREMIYGAVVIAIGLLFWGKRKPAAPPPTAPT